MKKKWNTPQFKTINSITEITLGGNGEKTEKNQQKNKNRRLAS